MDLLPIPSGGRADAARATARAAQNAWISSGHVAFELGICRRTLTRWLHDVSLGFPRPKIVNHRLYFERSAIDAWKAAIKDAEV